MNTGTMGGPMFEDMNKKRKMKGKMMMSKKSMKKMMKGGGK